MFSGRITRTVACFVVFSQVVVSVVLAAVIPAPQSMAREPREEVTWEPSDVMMASFGRSGNGSGESPEAAPLTTAAIDFEGVEEQPELQDAGGCQVLPVEESLADAYAFADASGDGRYSSDQLREQGVIYDGGVRYTWYSQQVLPGGGLQIEGRHVSEEGYVVDGQERIVVASNDLPWGTEIAVPFGTGCAVVLDSGCAPGTIDVYTNF